MAVPHIPRPGITFDDEGVEEPPSTPPAPAQPHSNPQVLQESGQGVVKSDATTEARAEGSHFLNLIDQGQFEAAWSDAGALFRNLVDRKIWAAGMNAVRKPMGYVSTRKIGNYSRLKALPGVPGNFMVIDYRTTFSRKSNVTERLILTPNELDEWRVISYQIR